MQDVSKGEGRTVLFVSHNMKAVQNLCKTGLLLENGKIAYSGGIDDVINYYLTNSLQTRRKTTWSREDAPAMNGIKLLSARVTNSEDILYAGDSIHLEFIFDSNETHPAEYNITFLLKDEMDNFLFEASTAFSSRFVEKTDKGLYRALATIPPGLLNEGTYRIWRIFFVKDKVTLQFAYDDAISFELKRRNDDIFGYQGRKMGLIKPNVSWQMTCNDEVIVEDKK